MKGKRQCANTRKNALNPQKILVVFFFLMISFPVPRTDAAATITQSDSMRLFSYPKLGFQISFPASWVVQDQSGDFPGEHKIEGRSTVEAPSALYDAKKPALSQKQQQIADIAFLKGIRVEILVQSIKISRATGMSLLGLVNNRIQGLKMMAKMAGDDVDVKPLQEVRLATVPSFVTKFTQTHNRYNALAQISTTTTYYDFESGARHYVIELSAPADEFDKHATEFTRIVQSFAFIEGN